MGSEDSIAVLSRRLDHLEAFVARFGFRPMSDEPLVAEPVMTPPPMPWPAPAAAAASPAVAPPPPRISQPLPPAPKGAAFARLAAVPPTTAPATTGSGVEQAIGLKVAGWIGAIVVAIGAAMGVKFAYDQGWLGGLPAEVKLGVLYAAALTLVAAGEWAYRKVNPLAAVGLYAAGVASLFVVGYAGSAYFDLYSQSVALALMAVACAIGTLISLRGGFASIAVLSYLGANVAPLILRDRKASEISLLVYLLALQFLAVGLAHVGRGGRWWVLRTIALIATSLWMTGRLIDLNTAHATATILFAAVYAVVFQLELVLFVRRSHSKSAVDESRGVPAPTNRAGDGPALDPDSVATFSAPTFSLAVTAAFVAALLTWTHGQPPLTRGGYLVALAAGLAISGAATLARATRLSVRSLATSYLTQAATLLFVAIPVALEGPTITLAWAGLAVSYAILGFAIRRPRTISAGAVVWSIAVVHLIANLASSASNDALRAIWMTVSDIPLPAYFFIAMLLGAAGHVVAILAGTQRVNRHRIKDDSVGDVLAVAASVCWAAAAIASLPALSATLVLVLAGWVLAAIAFFSRRPIYRGAAIGVIAVALAKWAAVDVLTAQLGEASPARRVLLNAPMAVGSFAAISLVLVSRLWTRPPRDAMAGTAVLQVWAAVVMSVVAMAIGMSVEVDRAAHLAVASGSPWRVEQLTMFGLTIVWLAAARVPAMVGRWIDSSLDRVRLAQRAADVVTIVLAIKFIVVDSILFAGPRVEVTPLLNVHGLVALGFVVVLLRMSLAYPRGRTLGGFARAMIFAVPLVYGSIELDRAVGPQQTMIAWSIFWGVYAVASIVLGFARASAAFRFAGLGLLAITLLKIVFIDLAAVATGWRILSFLAVGGLLLLTSVIYGKLTPRESR